MSAAATRVLPKLPMGVYTNAQPMPSAGPVSILLIDSLNSPPLGPLYMEFVVTAQHEIEHYIRSMPEGTEVAIFSLSFRGLHLLQGFTLDRNQLSHAMDTNFLVLASDDRPYGKGTFDNLDALNQIAAYVAPIKGRKNLLWFAPDMPVLLLRDGGLAWSLPPDMNYVHRVMDTYEVFTAEEIAVSPVDTRGVAGLGRTTLQMDAVADDTGGVAYHGSNDIKGEIAKAIDNSSDYYTLSYVPPSDDSGGHFHTITVKVARPGLHLVYRKGYNDEKPPQPAVAGGRGLMKASMEGQAPPVSQMLFNVRVQAGSEPITTATSMADASLITNVPPVAEQPSPPGEATSANDSPAPPPDLYSDPDPFANSDRFAPVPAPAAPVTPTVEEAAFPDAGTVPEQAAGSTKPLTAAAAAGRRAVGSKEKVCYTFLFTVPQSEIAFNPGPDGNRVGALEFDVAAYDEFGHLINGISQTMHMPLTPIEYADFIRTPFQFAQQLDLPPGKANVRIGILDSTSNRVGTLELQLNVHKSTPTAAVSASISPANP